MGTTSARKYVELAPVAPNSAATIATSTSASTRSSASAEKERTLSLPGGWSARGWSTGASLTGDAPPPERRDDHDDCEPDHQHDQSDQPSVAAAGDDADRCRKRIGLAALRIADDLRRRLAVALVPPLCTFFTLTLCTLIFVCGAPADSELTIFVIVAASSPPCESICFWRDLGTFLVFCPGRWQACRTRLAAARCTARRTTGRSGCRSNPCVSGGGRRRELPARRFLLRERISA